MAYSSGVILIIWIVKHYFYWKFLMTYQCPFTLILRSTSVITLGFTW